MSIVICIVKQNKEFYLASDHRAVRNGIVEDNYQKVYGIKENVYFGMTGIAEEGHKILNELKNYSGNSSRDLILYADSIIHPSAIRLTVMLSGADENGDFFIWQKNHKGEVTNATINDSSIAFSISSNQYINVYNKYLGALLSSGIEIEKAIELTIEIASKMDNTISPTFNLIKHA